MRQRFLQVIGRRMLRGNGASTLKRPAVLMLVFSLPAILFGNFVNALANASAEDDPRDFTEEKAQYSRDRFRQVELVAELVRSSLVFIVKNHGDKDLLIMNDFCFDPNISNAVFEAPGLRAVAGTFSSSTSHLQRGMARVRSKGERRCAIPFTGGQARQSTEARRGVIVWHTNLFVGDLEGNYSSLAFTGSVAVSLPIGIESEIDPPVDSSALIQYKSRNLIQIID